MGMEFRPYYLSREWVKMGHNVTIIAASYSHLRKSNPNVNRDFQEELIDGIKYIWIKTEKYAGNGVSRAKTMYQFVHRIRDKAESIIASIDPDVVITSSTYPLDTYAGQRIKNKSKKKVVLIHEVHDMWPLTPMLIGGMSKYNPFIMIMQRAENSAYKNSDRVVSLLSNAETYMKKHGLSDGKFSCIPNGIVEDEWNIETEPPRQHVELLNNLHNAGYFIAGYFGGHALSNALGTYLECAKSSGDDKICFVMVGDGTEKQKLVKQAKIEKISNVYFLPSIDKSAIPKLMSMVDCLCINSTENELYKYGVSPNKLLDYMMAAKPIVFSISTYNSIVELYDCGICTKPNDENDILVAINSIKNMSINEREIMGANGRTAVMKNYLYPQLAQNFLGIMNGEIK